METLMNVEYELLQMISQNHDAILEDAERHKASDFCALAGMKYRLKNLNLYAKVSQAQYETEYSAQHLYIRAALVGVLDNLEDALTACPEHALAWSAAPLPGLGQSKLRAAYYAKVVQSAMEQTFGHENHALVVESHGLGYKFRASETGVSVTVHTRWAALHPHRRTVEIPFPEARATTLIEEFAQAREFAVSVVKGTRDLIADTSYWPSLEDVRKCERRDAFLITVDALNTISGWKFDAVLEYPEEMERALKAWYQNRKAAKAARTQ